MTTRTGDQAPEDQILPVERGLTSMFRSELALFLPIAITAAAGYAALLTGVVRGVVAYAKATTLAVPTSFTQPSDTETYVILGLVLFSMFIVFLGCLQLSRYSRSRFLWRRWVLPVGILACAILALVVGLSVEWLAGFITLAVALFGFILLWLGAHPSPFFSKQPKNANEGPKHFLRTRTAYRDAATDIDRRIWKWCISLLQFIIAPAMVAALVIGIWTLLLSGVMLVSDSEYTVLSPMDKTSPTIVLMENERAVLRPLKQVGDGEYVACGPYEIRDAAGIRMVETHLGGLLSPNTTSC